VTGNTNITTSNESASTDHTTFSRNGGGAPGTNGSGALTTHRENGFTRDISARERRDTLSEKHREMLLVESSILPEVVTDRPYSTISAEEVRRLGFPTTPEQAGTEFLKIPLYSAAGGPSTGCQIRPDVPRTLKDSNGKPRIVKYEGEPRKPPIIDVPPRAFLLLQDLKTPLFIVEGSRKADAGASRGLCVISLAGVWAWLHSKVALPDWRLIPLKDRTVYIAFDDDVVTKKPVARALRDLGGFLELRGATVKVVDWAGGFNG
jgi:hypothetical protein